MHNVLTTMCIHCYTIIILLAIYTIYRSAASFFAGLCTPPSAQLIGWVSLNELNMYMHSIVYVYGNVHLKPARVMCSMCSMCQVCDVFGLNNWIIDVCENVCCGPRPNSWTGWLSSRCDPHRNVNVAMYGNRIRVHCTGYSTGYNGSDDNDASRCLAYW